jgi:hypothetical protein
MVKKKISSKNWLIEELSVVRIGVVDSLSIGKTKAIFT